MYKIILVGLGGFVGAVLRYLVSGVVQDLSPNAIFPYGTLLVNILGCFLIGVFSCLVEFQVNISAESRLLFMVGMIGSFSTYSTFSNETINLFREERLLLPLINIGAQVILGLLAVVSGRWVAIAIWR